MGVRGTLSFPLMVLLIVALFGAVASAEEGEEAVSKQFDLSGFTRIVLKGSSNVHIVQGDHYEVVARGSAETIPYAVAELRGNTLTLSVNDKTKSWFGIVTASFAPDIDYQVTLPAPEAIEVRGAGEVMADTLESKTLRLEVAGSGNIQIDKVAAETLSATVAGSGDLIVGTALAVEGEAVIMGSGDLYLGNIAGEKLTASIKGSGDIAVGGRVADLRVNIMGSGDFIGRNLRADSAGAQ